ncbi:hypothetical protein [Actinomyces wuliandei]|uniref:hypothetical protein n=1 Tax=Actinomyces wuliandei TaxID=2057743 RepID=UPI000FD8C72F|nr:hypothetical protein [Actinomyces wuliandei]
MIAVPVRRILFLAKAVVAGFGSFVVAIVSVVGSYGARNLIVDSAALAGGGAEDTRVLCGYVVYWTILGPFAFALSALMRSGVAGLATLLVTVLAASTYLLSLTQLARFLPDQAGGQMYQEVPPSANDLGPQIGLLAMLLWMLAAFLAGELSFRSWVPR